MFSRTFFLFALPLLAIATDFGGSEPAPAAPIAPARKHKHKPASQCNTGKLQCCQQIQEPGGNPTQKIQSLLASLGIGNIGVPVGLTCDPISVLGINGNSCNAQAVCCEGNNFNGLAVVGCTPVNLNL